MQNLCVLLTELQEQIIVAINIYTRIQIVFLSIFTTLLGSLMVQVYQGSRRLEGNQIR